MVINDNYKLAPWADVLYACDPKWWKWHIDSDEMKLFRGRKITQYERVKDSPEKTLKNREKVKETGLEYFESASLPKLSIDSGVIHQGSNSGFQAINVAYHYGAERIILLGYDMMIGTKAHWFGDHRDGVRSNYDGFMRFYVDMAPQAKELGLEIINCSRQTALKCFPRKPLNEVL